MRGAILVRSKWLAFEGGKADFQGGEKGRWEANVGKWIREYVYRGRKVCVGTSYVKAPQLLRYRVVIT